MRKTIGVTALAASCLLSAGGSQAADTAVNMRLASATNVVLGFDDGVSFIQDTASTATGRSFPKIARRSTPSARSSSAGGTTRS